MKATATSAATLLALAASATARTFTVYNACPFTIWPAVFTDLNVGSATPGIETGWSAAPYTARSFNVPDNWKAGRIWARRNCNFSSNPGPNSCADGGCNGGLLCDPRTGTGVPPATLAEWTLSAGEGGNWDYYDISLVDGYNLPAKITNNVGCEEASCPVDLGPNCPAALKGPFDSTGFPLGCKSDCLVDRNPGNSPSCCSGSHSTPQTCPPSGVPNYNYFKKNCPRSYVYAYDESSGTALFTCDARKKANYTLTFCPPP
ncbi:hypothetical protein BOTBODRAFT_169585 [Botryobasidium botryosum FD-172 SS1]|uniref:Thaumatin-like protein n=1 Tax=Botryobasidium botryosum (strain FD-172 SS1) TaxID=930990 RepID=A0A067N9V5_BOTB1|nr:hypothetical protein BOTBODRAFT_169585 [Botryobasidium botryosum FD-172 SS1]